MKNKKLLKNHSFQDGLLFLALSVALLVYSFYNHYTGMKVDWKMSPYLFPIIIALFLLLLSVLLLIGAVNEVKKTEGEAEKEEPAYFNYKNFILTLALVIAYYYSMKFVSFILATIVLLALLLLLFNERRWWMVLLVSVLTTGALYLLFSVGLHVNLP